MTERYLAYPLLLLMTAQLVSLWRADRRWHRAPILQRCAVLLLAGLAMLPVPLGNLWVGGA